MIATLLYAPNEDFVFLIDNQSFLSDYKAAARSLGQRLPDHNHTLATPHNSLDVSILRELPRCRVGRTVQAAPFCGSGAYIAFELLGIVGRTMRQDERGRGGARKDQPSAFDPSGVLETLQCSAYAQLTLFSIDRSRQGVE